MSLALALISVLVAAAESERLPNLDQMQYGFNVLRGQQPAEQRRIGAQEKLFSFTKGPGTETLFGKTYERPREAFNYHDSSLCSWHARSSEVAWSNSAKSLSWQSKTYAGGYDKSTDIGVSVPVQAAEVSAETTVRDALLFGNSKTSSESFAQQSSGRTYTFEAKGVRFLYSSKVAWNNISTWSPALKNGASALGSSPSDAQLLEFWRRFGTHGLSQAQFGRKCTSSLFFEEGQSLTEYTKFKDSNTQVEGAMTWFAASGSQSGGSQEIITTEEGFSHAVDDKECIGSLKLDSDCGGIMLKGTGVADEPALNEVTYKAIWDMSLLTQLSSGAKARMKDLMGRMIEAQAQCGKDHCSWHGVCAGDLSVWGSEDAVAQAAAANGGDLSAFWDGGKCFCNDGFVGASCQEARDVALSTLTWDTEWANDYDKELNYRKTVPLCGVTSKHNNGKEDRRFKFGTCKVLEAEFKYPGAEYLLPFTTRYDDDFARVCPTNMFLTGLWSEHDNGKEDRRWRFYCRQFGQTEQGKCQWDGSYQNDWDDEVNKQCKAGSVLAGVQSVHSNDKEDRRWKYLCCTMAVHRVSYVALQEDDTGDYVNKYDKPQSYEAKVSTRLAAIAGVKSSHKNSKDDRRFWFYARTLPPYPSLNSLETLSETGWDAAWVRECPANKALVKWNSYHKNSKEDRKFTFTCGQFEGVVIDACYWSGGDRIVASGGWMTQYDDDWSFKCAPGFVMAGVQSRHSNGKEDRQFNFKCCRFRYRDESAETGYQAEKKSASSLSAQRCALAALSLLAWVAAVAWWVKASAQEKAKKKKTQFDNYGYGSVQVIEAN